MWRIYDPTLYLSGSSFVPEVEDKDIASAEYKDGKIYIQGLKQGQTKASITSGSVTQTFVITVRDTVSDNGWL